MMAYYNSAPNFKRNCFRSVIVATLASVGLLSGIVPGLSGNSPQLVSSNSAYAQDVSKSDLTNYAKAVLAMEPLRLSAYNEIKKIVGSVPSIVCNQEQISKGLPKNAQGIAINYCNQSKKIIISNDLTTELYNKITVQLQSDSNLQKKVQNELIRLQRKSR
jgi:hypothetical protein